jgi:ABC-2 type transport system permease protein
VSKDRLGAGDWGLGAGADTMPLPGSGGPVPHHAGVLARPFPFLLLPSLWAAGNRARRRERGDLLRGLVFGGIALGVIGALVAGAFWVTFQAMQYAELGDYLIRIGLSWLFLTFLSFLAFSGVVSALATFFLSDDLRLVMTAPVTARRVFLARFARTLAQAGWMVVVFLVPVLAGVGLAKCAPLSFVAVATLTVTPFVVIPVGLGAAVTLLLVNVFPARRARDILMLMGLVFAVSLVILLRVVQPERLLRVESMPVVTDFFATLQSPVTPFLPSFWAGEAIFAGLHGSPDWLHLAALWSTAAAVTIVLAAAFARWHFAGYSQSQEARKARFAQWRGLDRVARWLPLSPVRRQLLVKDVKVFLRDVSQWSQLLLLLALVLVYLYNFRVLDLDRVPGMSGVIKNAYAFLNMGMAGFVMATVTVRFVFPAVSAEGAAFWIIRTAPISLRDFLWSKFWTGLLPVLLLTECLVVAGNYFLGTDPFLKLLTAIAVAVMAFALVGLAAGLGARYPRFAADNPSQVAGSYGGVAFMVAAVLYVLAMIVLLGWPSSVYLFAQARRRPLTEWQMVFMGAALTTALAMSVAIWLLGMRSGVKALQDMDRTPA